MRRRLRLSAKHALGAAALVCVAGSAAFLERMEAREVTARGMVLHAVFPGRMRFREVGKITLDATRAASEPCRAAALQIDESYLERFDESRSIPAEAEIGRFSLGDLAPGERRRVVLYLRGERPWLAAGVARLSCDGVSGPAVPLRTFIFP
jgi:hypothetical protein